MMTEFYLVILIMQVKALVTSQLKVNSGTLPTNADHQTKESAGGESSQKEEQVKVCLRGSSIN